MEILQELIPSPTPTSAALGYFDGVHRGHQAVIAEAVAAAKAQGLRSTVFTLQQSPRVLLLGEKPQNIMTTEDKLSVLEALGVEQVYLIDFAAVRQITAEDFVEKILRDRFHARHLSCGFNYHFGAGAAGSGEMLEDMCRTYGISVFARPRITFEEMPISSTRIRKSILQGQIEEVNAMLGRPYGFFLPVIHGEQVGRTWGTPTLNQAFPEGLVQPLFGVYASRVTIDGSLWCGVTNIGVRPTVGSRSVLIETWMPDYHGPDLYGQTLRVDLLRFIRPERRFDTTDALRREILRNASQAQQIFRELPLP